MARAEVSCIAGVHSPAFLETGHFPYGIVRRAAVLMHRVMSRRTVVGSEDGVVGRRLSHSSAYRVAVGVS